MIGKKTIECLIRIDELPLSQPRRKMAYSPANLSKEAQAYLCKRKKEEMQGEHLMDIKEFGPPGERPLYKQKRTAMRTVMDKFAWLASSQFVQRMLSSQFLRQVSQYEEGVAEFWVKILQMTFQRTLDTIQRILSERTSARNAGVSESQENLLKEILITSTTHPSEIKHYHPSEMMRKVNLADKEMKWPSLIAVHISGQFRILAPLYQMFVRWYEPIFWSVFPHEIFFEREEYIAGTRKMARQECIRQLIEGVWRVAYWWTLNAVGKIDGGDRFYRPDEIAEELAFRYGYLLTPGEIYIPDELDDPTPERVFEFWRILEEMRKTDRSDWRDDNDAREIQREKATTIMNNEFAWLAYRRQEERREKETQEFAREKQKTEATSKMTQERKRKRADEDWGSPWNPNVKTVDDMEEWKNKRTAN